ncbi:MAG: ecotin family protein [Rhizobiales bacterium]|nr:ecotin family protein [Hyphomicrobiales bacterium]
MFRAVALALGLVCAAASARAGALEDYLKPFPAAVDGAPRHVIAPPARRDEEARKIEIRVGRVMNVDCNTRGLIGRFEEKTLEGWGYSYLVFVTRGEVVQTMMACPETTKRKGFVAGPPHLARYNSRAPLAVYAPEGYEVRYRVFGVVGEERPAGRR